ncbi:MAG: phosphate ABC transporter permease subunit PstC [Candidatus Krumholzibacteriota bacterium]|nr:phosphate ABC transporter permease subunit PstC [Candidatus Krumholzibacteriota bacterium]
MAEAGINSENREFGSRLLMGARKKRIRMIGSRIGHSILVLVASSSLIALLFIFYFIIRDAVPFFQLEGFREFFSSTKWYPSRETAEFGALAIFVGSGLVTLGAVLFSVPVGALASLCLSDILPFSMKQIVKPVIEMLAAIPSVVYGFFALVIFAPMLQEKGGSLLSVGALIVLVPLNIILVIVVSDLLSNLFSRRMRLAARIIIASGSAAFAFLVVSRIYLFLNGLVISSGTNAINASVVLGIMALPTIVSVSEDALNAVGRELREGSYALGATRAETLLKVVMPAAKSGITAAVILGVMRAIGETMVVWMASGNASRIPKPWFNLLEPVRTLTATIAGDMGEADHVTGSARYHVLFAMALCLLVIAFVSNLISEMIVRRSRKRVA